MKRDDIITMLESANCIREASERGIITAHELNSILESMGLPPFCVDCTGAGKNDGSDLFRVLLYTILCLSREIDELKAKQK